MWQKNKKLLFWFFLNGGALLIGFYLRSKDADGALFFLYLMYFITFPMGFFAPIIFICISKYIYDFNQLYNSFPFIVDIFIPWILFVLLGYLQWFVIIPKIKRYF